MWTYGDGSVRDQKSGVWGAVCGKSTHTVLLYRIRDNPKVGISSGGGLHLPDIDLEVLNLLMNLLMQIPGFLKKGIRDDNIIFRFALYSYDDKEHQ